MAAGGVEAWNTSELLAACCGAAVKVWSPFSAEPRREVKVNEGTEVHALDWSVAAAAPAAHHFTAAVTHWHPYSDASLPEHIHYGKLAGYIGIC